MKDTDSSNDKIIRIDLDEIKNCRKIIINCTDQQLNSIKDIVPQLKTGNNIKKMGNDVYELKLNSIEVSVKKILLNPTLGELQDKNGENDETMLNFENSEEFYAKAKTKNSFKIIYDEYSAERNSRLYGAFGKIESIIRIEVSKNQNTKKVLEDSTKNPGNYRSKLPDSIIAQYSLGEFFEIIFDSRPSEKYLKEFWQNSSEQNMQTALEMTRLTTLDEINLHLSRDELKKIREYRNSCMHFRVISLKEYEEAVNLLNKYLKFIHTQEFVKSMQESIKMPDMSNLLSSMLPSVSIAQTLNRAISSIRNIDL